MILGERPEVKMAMDPKGVPGGCCVNCVVLVLTE